MRRLPGGKTKIIKVKYQMRRLGHLLRPIRDLISSVMISLISMARMWLRMICLGIMSCIKEVSKCSHLRKLNNDVSFTLLISSYRKTKMSLLTTWRMLVTITPITPNQDQVTTRVKEEKGYSKTWKKT